MLFQEKAAEGFWQGHIKRQKNERAKNQCPKFTQ